MRGAPRIQDHEVLRCIGRGSYGEVWIARGVTGVLRAVKVIWREDYDEASIFERELEGLKRFEPISRRNAGLVDILQVGVNEEDDFYYYVMELADDVERGRDIEPESYIPHTFSAEMARRESIDRERCLRDGAVLAEALYHMHQHGLIHRDVKPSNVIYVEGEAKLADIGLVAISGQRSFVGTEGFVPPEGPGTPAADIYSLGMVLYEMGTGKDRLDFPDVPTNLGDDKHRPLWTRLNKVICKACAAQAKDRFASAAEMAQALRGEKLPGGRKLMGWAVAATLMLAALGAGLGTWWQNENDAASDLAEDVFLDIDDLGVDVPLELNSYPPGAEVYEGEDFLGATPLTLTKPAGARISLTMRLEGYKNLSFEHLVGGRKELSPAFVLEEWIQPQPGERWRNSLDMEFAPRTGRHVSLYPVSAEHFYRFLDTTGRAFEGEVVPYQPEGEKEVRFIVVVPNYDAEAFRSWLTEKDRAEGYLSTEHSYLLERFSLGGNGVEAGGSEADKVMDGEMAFRCVVEKQNYGRVFISSTPEGAVIFQRGIEIGRTSTEFPRVKTGSVQYELRLEGYKPVLIEGEVLPNELKEFYVDMEETRAVVFGREWKNSLAMEFVPVGDILFSVWETRVRDFEFFSKEARRKWRNSVSWEQKPTLPALQVSLDEARAFCKWLTEYERERGVIEENHEYRLPTDLEWSRAVGLRPERGLDPASRSGRQRGVYPWGFGWPPPPRAGDFADRLEVDLPDGKKEKVKYEDGARYTAPSTLYEANGEGICNLAGNVWEWVGDSYGGSDPQTADWGVVRGGSWQSATSEELLSSHRRPLNPGSRLENVGFRCVLARAEESESPLRD